ncbi:MaoC family dehydratase [Actinomadura rugatobispora]|uniref:MaoC family dehydratase n=1 Tax=Actinomadura rugatobispora TaxID=1994 RepID=A0ABW0ZTL2_9ACTN|nr:MaoC family dehydratase [Actinomadura rugatobispora]
MRVLSGVDEIRGAVGQHLGHSGYRTVTQQDIDTFAGLTGDDQWIHVDTQRAAQGPYGGTIAHGLLTLSLGPRLVREIYRIEGMRMGVNYGYDKIRFPSPVPVGSKVRVGAEIEGVEDVKGGLLVRLRFTWEVEGSPKPACVASMLLRYVV